MILLEKTGMVFMLLSIFITCARIAFLQQTAEITVYVPCIFFVVGFIVYLIGNE